MCFAHYNSKDYSTVQVVFEATNLKTKGDTIPFPTPLCTRHYYTVYNAQRAHLANCPVCGICLKHVQSRPCPNALRDTAGFEISLQPEQKVCYSCYKSQLIILQEQEELVGRLTFSCYYKRSRKIAQANLVQYNKPDQWQWKDLVEGKESQQNQIDSLTAELC